MSSRFFYLSFSVRAQWSQSWLKKKTKTKTKINKNKKNEDVEIEKRGAKHEGDILEQLTRIQKLGKLFLGVSSFNTATLT